jgi:hypothetical protein
MRFAGFGSQLRRRLPWPTPRPLARRPANHAGGLAIVLVVGASLLVRSFLRLVAVDNGYSAAAC